MKVSPINSQNNKVQKVSSTSNNMNKNFRNTFNNTNRKMNGSGKKR